MPQPQLRAYHPSLGERLQQGVSGLLAKVGFDERHAQRLGKKLFGALEAVTPIGNVTGAHQGVRDMRAGVRRRSVGQAASGAIGAALSALPIPAPARKIIGRASSGMFGAAKKPIRAWHGSDKDFDKFSDDFIGAGEGAQGYGYGHYLSESRRLANSYRNPKLIPNPPPNHGRLYEVDINAQPEDFIEWDAPLRDMPEQVQRLARTADLSHLNPGHRNRSVIERFTQGGEDPGYPALGHHLHNALTDYGANTEANRRLSQMLAGEGFAGFRYGQPRDALGGGGRNYVVFNPDIIDILNRH